MKKVISAIIFAVALIILVSINPSRLTVNGKNSVVVSLPSEDVSSPPSANNEEAFTNEFHWIPGGVTSHFDDSAAQVEIDGIFRAILTNTSKDLLCQDWQRNVHSGAAFHFLRRLSRQLGSVAFRSTDCLMHLPPHLKASCLIARMLSADKFPDAYVKSGCHKMVRCMLWSKGRFSVPLSQALLDRGYQSAKSSFKMQTMMFEHFHKNFVHFADAENELPWLLKRSQIHATEAIKWNGEIPEVPTDVRGAFQEDELYLSSEGNALATGVFSGMSKKLFSLSPLEMLGVLNRFVTKRSEELGKKISVVLISGDSQARDFFYRIINFVRYARITPSGTYSEPPFYEVLGHADWVYSVYENHDELSLFAGDEAQTNERNITGYLRRIRDDKTAILHIVFCWDTFSESPKKIPWSYTDRSPSFLLPWAHDIGVAAHVESTTAWEPTRHTNMYSNYNAIRNHGNSMLYSMNAMALELTANNRTRTTPTQRYYGVSTQASRQTITSRDITSVAAHFQGASPIVSTCVGRNIEHFGWLYNTTKQSSPIAIFDQAKLQLLPGATMADAVHFSCHCFTASFQKHFAFSTKVEAIDSLLGKELSRCATCSLPNSNERLSAYLAWIMRRNGMPFANIGRITGREEENMRRTGYPVDKRTFYVSPIRSPSPLCENRPSLLLWNVALFSFYDRRLRSDDVQI